MSKIFGVTLKFSTTYPQLSQGHSGQGLVNMSLNTSELLYQTSTYKLAYNQAKVSL